MYQHKRNLPSLWLCCGFILIWSQIPLYAVVACRYKSSCHANFTGATTGTNWKQFMEAILDMKIFTLAFEHTEQYAELQFSANKMGIKIHTIGMNEKLYNEESYLPMHSPMLRLLREAIRPYRKNYDLIILFISNRVNLTRESLVKIYRNFKLKNVMGISQGMVEPVNEARTLRPAEKLVGSGLFIGYAPFVHKMLENDYYAYEPSTFLTLRKINFIIKPEIVQPENDADDVVDYEPVKFDQYQISPYREESEMPTITLVIVITQAVPFFEFFLKKIEKIDYPKKMLHLFIYNTQKFHEAMLVKFLEQFKDAYLSVQIIQYHENIKERQGREMALAYAQEQNSDYMFVVEADAHIDEPKLLKDLLAYNMQFIAPVLLTQVHDWDLLYNLNVENIHPQDSHLLKYRITTNLKSYSGIWNVSFATSVYLIEKSAFTYIDFNRPFTDPDFSLCDSLNQAGISTFVTNQKRYGHLVDTQHFNQHKIGSDMYMYFHNRKDWAKKYVHPKYLNILNSNASAPQPCKEVYYLPLVSEAFCDDLVAIMENNGTWYYNCKTRGKAENRLDAVGLNDIWLTFLDCFVRPVQLKIFPGHTPRLTKVFRNIVISSFKDRPILDPQHDNVKYSLSIGLKEPGVDYKGGGIRFMRYNCTVRAGQKGWAYLYPGHFTHVYEDLMVTKGINYILRSLIDSPLNIVDQEI